MRIKEQAIELTKRPHNKCEGEVRKSSRIKKQFRKSYKDSSSSEIVKQEIPVIQINGESI